MSTHVDCEDCRGHERDVGGDKRQGRERVKVLAGRPVPESHHDSREAHEDFELVAVENAPSRHNKSPKVKKANKKETAMTNGVTGFGDMEAVGAKESEVNEAYCTEAEGDMVAKMTLSPPQKGVLNVLCCGEQ